MGPRGAGTGPKVGLILSGGGAKGLAHIGVLRYLEEQGIRPDYIAGTSMGAILGGLYACGYTAGQLEELVVSQDWNRLLSSAQDLSEVELDLKPTVEREQLLLAWRDGRFQVPLGLVEGRNLWTLFQRLTWPQAHVSDFDSLVIPFRCVAVNIRRASLREFAGGSLPFAMRASMAIPGAFTPIALGDTALYVDGGVMDNFPYRTLRRMGAEVVLGSYVGPLPVTDSSVFAPRDILVRASMFTGMIRAFGEMDSCDVLFTPAVGNVGVLDFSHARGTMRRGYEEAARHGDRLRALLGNASGEVVGRDTLDRARANWVNRIEIEGAEGQMSKYLHRRLGLRVPGALTGMEVQEGLQRLYSSRLVRQVDYQLDSLGVLRLRMQMREGTMLGVAANINSEWGAALIVRLQTPSPFPVIGRTQMDVEVSTQPRIKTNHYLYFNDQMHALLNVGAYYSSSRLPFYRSTQKIAAIWEHLFEAEVSYGHVFHGNAMLEGGGALQVAWLFPNEAYVLWLEQSTGRIRQREYSLFARFQYNSLDRHYYPSRGVRVYWRVNYAFRPDFQTTRRLPSIDGGAALQREFGKSPQSLGISARAEAYVPLGHPRVVGFGASYLGVYTSSVGRFSGFRIGGMNEVQRDPNQDMPFYGLGYRQLTTNNALVVSVGVRVNVWRSFYGTLRGGAMAYSDLTSDFVRSLFAPSDYLLGYGVSAGWRTRLGVMEGSVTGSSAGRLPWFYFHLGIPF